MTEPVHPLACTCCVIPFGSPGDKLIVSYTRTPKKRTTTGPSGSKSVKDRDKKTLTSWLKRGK